MSTYHRSTAGWLAQTRRDAAKMLDSSRQQLAKLPEGSTSHKAQVLRARLESLPQVIADLGALIALVQQAPAQDDPAEPGAEQETPVPTVGDKAVLTDRNGRQDKGWKVVRVVDDGAHVSISHNGFVKHLNRTSDGHYVHAPGVYATFTPAERTQEG